MQQLVAVLGTGVIDSARDSRPALVSADDLGFTRGDGVFDATRVVTASDGSSSVDHLDRHLERFARSIALLDGPAPHLGAWSALIQDAVGAWTVPGEATLKIMWTRGPETTAGEPFGVLTITPMTEGLIAQRQGVTVAALSRGYSSTQFRDMPWLLGGAKTLSYAVNMAAKREASRRGAQDVLFTSTDGYCLEAPTSALLAMIGDTLVTTPVEGTGILASITQQVVFEQAAAAGVATEYRLVRPEELFDARGCWFASSVRGTVPLLALDGRALPQDAGLTATLARWSGF